MTVPVRVSRGNTNREDWLSHPTSVNTLTNRPSGDQPLRRFCFHRNESGSRTGDNRYQRKTLQELGPVWILLSNGVVGVLTQVLFSTDSHINYVTEIGTHRMYCRIEFVFRYFSECLRGTNILFCYLDPVLMPWKRALNTIKPHQRT